MSSSPLRVAMTVEQLWQPVPGGSGTYIDALASAFGAVEDIEVHGIAARSARAEPGRFTAAPLETSGLPRPVLYEAWSRLRRPRVPGPGGQASSGYDVVHATTWAIPPRSAPLVATVHDTAFLRNPDHFTARGVAFFERSLRIVRREADIVVVPSEATRTDCVSAGIEPDRIRVIPHGTAQHRVSSDAADAFRAQHGLARPFVLWCGTLEPRKNLPVLLHAFERLLEDGSDLDLVIVGPSGWGSTSDEVRAAVDRLPVDRIHVLGRLSDIELQRAYASARVFCFPSTWEGFGMPVLEAMVHGTPVVTSRGTSMAEIVGDGALLVDPLDPRATAAALVRAAVVEHDALAEGAVRNSSRYTWDRSARAHLAAYRDAVELAATTRGGSR
ncbi:glycosyltransferase family 4 protein [Sanguibacter sp. YZGR15]|uniref:Glycosyltransferase family 4 protein n=2 Tax=Sanguibacter suaedae TaxID=2795737 RepID=A0A934IA91_9MICO|nr:glycosyltransferase family 4 protein [Sanguibacter suaedae]